MSQPATKPLPVVFLRDNDQRTNRVAWLVSNRDRFNDSIMVTTYEIMDLLKGAYGPHWQRCTEQDFLETAVVIRLWCTGSERFSAAREAWYADRELSPRNDQQRDDGIIRAIEARFMDARKGVQHRAPKADALIEDDHAFLVPLHRYNETISFLNQKRESIVAWRVGAREEVQKESQFGWEVMRVPRREFWIYKDVYHYLTWRGPSSNRAGEYDVADVMETGWPKTE